MKIIELKDFDALFSALKKSGYTIIAPVLSDDAIVYSEVSSSSELPAGWIDEQEGGTYRLKRNDSHALFNYTVGPTSWKKYLFPPLLKLFSVRKTTAGFEVTNEKPQPDIRGGEESRTGENKKFAFIGVRSCELNALGIQDKIFATTAYADPYYKTIREDCLIIAVNCVRAGGTCFCSSMKTGPQCDSGYDIVITEVNGRSIHHFVVEAGTDKGKELLAQCITRPAEEKECERAKQLIAEAAKQMGRALDTANLKELLYRNFENSRWDEISTKCLTCGNCTMVCPTCFCSIVEELTDLAGENADRWRKWDTCFRIDFAYIHGGSIRSTPRSRYRQWMTHKFASWIDQFGAFGCVGCGRCITWCPVGIDITAEINLIRQSETTK